MEYRGLCQKILQLDRNITDVFIVSPEARLVTFSAADDAVEIGEDRLAELMEDLLFMISSRRHYEDLFGALQYLHIRHKLAETFVLPFERDMLLCISSRKLEDDEAQFLTKVHNMITSIQKYV